MTHATDIATLVRWLAADFSNQQQAFENPPLYAHIRVCMRPLPKGIVSGVGLLLEQAYDLMLDKPYRLRVLNLFVKDGQIVMENCTIQDASSFYGASRDPQLLATLTADRIEKMCGCDMLIDWTGKSFKGVVEPGKACIVVRDDRTTYLDNQFEVDANGLISIDCGRDPETDERVWGSIAGPFHFTRWASFANEVQL